MSAVLDLLLRLQDQATPGLRDATGAVEGLDRAAGNAGGGFSVLQGAASWVIGGAVTAGFNAITNGVGSLIGGMISGNAQFETYNQQFGVLLGSSEAAQQRLEELAAFGATTPFELPQVVEADKILQGFGLHSEEAAQKFGYSGEQIRTIAGDVASGTGASFSEMTLLLGKFSAGATGEAISRMQEMGITTREELAGMGLEFSASGQLMSPLPEAMAVVLGIMEDKYGGMMAAQSTTFAGMMSNLEDWKGATIRRLGEPIFEAVHAQLGNLLAFINSPATMAAIDGFADMLAEGIGTAVDWFTNTALPAMQEFFGWLRDEGIPQFQAFAAPIIAALIPALLQLSDWFSTALPPVIAAVMEFVSWKDLLIILGGVLVSIIVPALLSLVGTVLSVVAPIVAVIAIVALLRQAWEQNLGGIQEKIAVVIAFIQNVIMTVMTAVLEFWAANGEQILATAQRIWDFIVTAVTLYINLYWAIITTVAQAIADFWAANGEQILLKAQEIWAAIQVAIQIAITTIQTIVTAVAMALADFWAAHGAQILTTAQQIWTAISTFIQTAITTIQTIVTTVATALSDFWAAHGELILETAQRIWTTVQEYISGVWATIQALFAAFKAAFEGDWTGFGENLRLAWQTAWQTIVTYLGNIWSIVAPILATLVLNAINYLQGINWGEVGSSIAHGIADGLSSAAGAIADAARAAAQAALDAAKALLGISSPSKVFELQVGKNMALGAAKGLRAGASDVTTAAQQLFAPTLVSVPTSAAGGRVGGAASGQVIYNFDFRNSIIRSEDELERMIGKALRQKGAQADVYRRTR